MGVTFREFRHPPRVDDWGCYGSCCPDFCAVRCPRDQTPLPATSLMDSGTRSVTWVGGSVTVLPGGAGGVGGLEDTMDTRAQAARAPCRHGITRTSREYVPTWGKGEAPRAPPALFRRTATRAPSTAREGELPQLRCGRGHEQAMTVERTPDCVCYGDRSCPWEDASENRRVGGFALGGSTLGPKGYRSHGPGRS